MTSTLFQRHPEALERHYLETGLWNDETVHGLLDRRAVDRAGHVAVEEVSGRTATYAELSDASRRLANSLLSLGLRKGDVVAIQLPSGIDFLTAYFGVTRMGGILATIHMPYRDNEAEPLLRFAEARAVICAPATAKYDGPKMMARLRARVPSLEHVIVAGADGGGEREAAAGKDWQSFSALVARGSLASVPNPGEASDPAILCFTSGTSAAPKAVAHCSRTLTANARVYAPFLGLGPDDKSLVAPPFTHVFGLECVHNAMTTGGTILPLQQFSPEVYAATIHRQRPSIVYSAPAHLAATLKAGVLDGRDLTSVRHVVLGGSICPPHIAREFERHLPNGHVGGLFGMTELLIATQTPPSGSPDVRHATVGRPLPGVEARIVDAQGHVLPAGEEGELQLRGFSVMSGYVRNDAANARAFTPDGWFRTGDLGQADADGHIAITGRLTDVINRGGIKINPSDIENAIAGHEAVVQVALVPMPDDVLGERICAVVVLAEGASLALDDLCAYLGAKGLAKSRWPERLLVVEEMPMTPTRKIVKSQLVRSLEGRLG